MFKILRDYFQTQRGVAAVEFALLAPILVMLFVGVAEYGRYLNAVMRLENTARAAAEYMVQGGDEASLASDVIATRSSLTAEEKAGMTFSANMVCECNNGSSIDCEGSCGTDDYVRRYFEVTVGMTYDPLTSIPAVSDSITLNEFVRLQVN